MAKDMWDMSDEEAEAAFDAAKAELESPEDGLDNEGEEATEEQDEFIEEQEEEEEEEELEQPEMDSDDDTSSEADEEEGTEEDSEGSEDNLDGESEEAEEQTEAVVDKTEAEEQPAQAITKFRANGQDYEFTDAEMKAQFGKVFGQAMDYTKKTQHMKQHRKTIDAMEQAGLGVDDVNLMIDVLKGDKEAITNVLKRTGVDALDLDTDGESKYVPKDYGRNDVELDIKDVIDGISSDKEYVTTQSVLEKQWDDKSRDAFVEDPKMIKALHIDVQSGMFDKVNPMAQKLKVYDGGAKSDLDYYKMAANQYFDNQSQNEARAKAQSGKDAQFAADAEASKVAEVKAAAKQRATTKQASQKRKAATPSSRNKVGTKSSTDYLDDSDEAFEDWYAKIQDSQ